MILLTALLSGLLMNDVAPGDSHARSEVRLLAQAERLIGDPRGALKTRIENLDLQIRNVRVDWPVGAIVAMVFGVVVTVVGLMTGFVAAIVLSSLGGGIVALLLVPLQMLPGIALVVVSALVGSSSAEQARKTREALLKERSALQQQLKAMPQQLPIDPNIPPPQVGNEAPPLMLTLVQF